MIERHTNKRNIQLEWKDALEPFVDDFVLAPFVAFDPFLFVALAFVVLDPFVAVALDPVQLSIAYRGIECNE